MVQQISFQATHFGVQPVEVDMEALREQMGPDAAPPDLEDLPVAALIFNGGAQLALNVAVSRQAAEGVMNAFTQAEGSRGNIPKIDWQPVPAFLPGLSLVLSPALVSLEVTPPHQGPEGIVPFWALTVVDPEGSQVQVQFSDAMSVQVVRALAQVAHGELDAGDDEDDDED
ncbi:MAG: hypothetical protein KDC33_00900 [Thermoleophilia bacterium]|nr:hypothetical protein [Thermoleophilia bacterium]